MSGDVEHFVWFNGRFAKDGKYCFLQNTKLRNVDHASFTVLNNCYTKDHQSVWTTGGRFEPEDIGSFVVCDDGVGLIEKIQTMIDGTLRPVRVQIPYGYAKDSKTVYLSLIHIFQVRYRYDWHIGAIPERYTYDKTGQKLPLLELALDLSPGDYGRAICNGRFRDWDTGIWYYALDILNVLLPAAPTNALTSFMDREPSKVYTQIDRLW